MDKDGNRRGRNEQDMEDVEVDADVIDLSKQMEQHKLNMADVRKMITKIHDKKQVPNLKLDEINVDMKFETKYGKSGRSLLVKNSKNKELVDKKDEKQKSLRSKNNYQIASNHEEVGEIDNYL